MVTREELSSLIAEIHKNEVQGLAEDSESTREQRKERYKDWTTLFRRNLDIFNQDFLEIDVAEFQKVMINNISDNDAIDFKEEYNSLVEQYKLKKKKDTIN